MTRFRRKKPQETHGGFTEIRRYRERKLDMRRADDKALAAWQTAIVNDLGGADQLDMMQNSLLDRCTELLIILRCMAEHVETTGPMGKDGNLQPCLRNSYICYANSFRRMLETIYQRSDKRPPKPPDLDDYVREKYGEGESA